VQIAGVERATGRSDESASILQGTLNIVESLTLSTPNRCSFVAMGFAPSAGDRVVVTLGGEGNPERLFYGSIVSVSAGYVGTPSNRTYECVCLDDTYLLDARIVNKRFTSTSATAIAIDLVAGAVGFTAEHVQSGLPTVDEITFTNESISVALLRLAKRIGGYVYLDQHRDIHLYTSESIGAELTPTALTSAHESLERFEFGRDWTDVATRVYSEGGGSQASEDTAAGATTLAVDDTAWYSASGGLVRCGAQRISYAGIGSSAAENVGAWNGFNVAASVVDIQSVAWAPSLGLFMAPKLSGVYTSSDGTTWTSNSAPTSFWYSVAWSESLGLGVMGGTTGTSKFTTATSSDGVTWTESASTDGGLVTCVRWFDNVSLFVATGNRNVGATQYATIETSPDGVTWTRRYTPGSTSTSVFSVAWSESLGLFLAVGGTGNFQTSPDAITWTDHTKAGLYNSVAWSPTAEAFVICGNSGILRSTDGTTYSTVTNPVTGQAWRRVDWIDELGVFLMWAGAVAIAQNLAISADGLTWTTYAAVSTLAVGGTGGSSAVAYSAALGKTIVVGSTSGSFQMAVSAATSTGQLTGIPASGDGAIRYAISAGDDVNVVAQVDDVAAQTAFTAAFGTDGVKEETIQDGRLSLTEAQARGEAYLALRSSPRTSIRYRTRDKNTRAGRTVSATLSEFGLSAETFRIQKVTISNFQPSLFPYFDAEASDELFSFEDMVRQFRSGETV